jgi:hypothetical protein
MQESGLKRKIYSALRKMLPLLIGFSLGLAVVLASESHQSYTNFLYSQPPVEGRHQSPIGDEHGYGIPYPYIVHRVYWNLSAPIEQLTFTESDEFDLGMLIEGWIELSVIITLGIWAYKSTDEWILKRSRNG